PARRRGSDRAFAGREVGPLAPPDRTPAPGVPADRDGGEVAIELGRADLPGGELVPRRATGPPSGPRTGTRTPALRPGPDCGEAETLHARGGWHRADLAGREARRHGRPRREEGPLLRRRGGARTPSRPRPRGPTDRLE